MTESYLAHRRFFDGSNKYSTTRNTLNGPDRPDRRFYALRNTTDPLANDETRAMAHEQLGPFPTPEKARQELVRMMREEAGYLSDHNALRAAAINDAAAEIEEDGLDQILVVGLKWSVSPYTWA